MEEEQSNITIAPIILASSCLLGLQTKHKKKSGCGDWRRLNAGGTPRRAETCGIVNNPSRFIGLHRCNTFVPCWTISPEMDGQEDCKKKWQFVKHGRIAAKQHAEAEWFGLHIVRTYDRSDLDPSPPWLRGEPFEIEMLRECGVRFPTMQQSAVSTVLSKAPRP